MGADLCQGYTGFIYEGLFYAYNIIINMSIRFFKLNYKKDFKNLKSDITAKGIFEDENMDRIVTMEIEDLDISQINYWDVSDNSEMIFIASTVDTSEVFNYLNLDSEWSPYYLFDDLVVSGLMEIEDGVDLQISTSKGITINGELNIGSASLHGEDWAGIFVDGGEINFEGTYILNAIQSLELVNYSSAELGNVTFYNSINGHLMISSGSSVTLSYSTLELGDNCIKTSTHNDNILNINY